MLRRARAARLQRTAALLVSALFAMPALAGCGATSSEGAGPGTRLEMHIGVQSLVLQTFYPQLAEDLGYFDDENLDVTISVGESTSNSVQGLLGGSIDAYLGGPEGLSANEQGADLRFVVAAANRSIWNVVAAPGTKSIKDLEGKSIGVSAIQSISTATTRQALAAHGVNVKKLKYIVAGGTSKRFAALEADRIAAAPLGIPVNYQASESSGLVDLGNTNDLGAPVLVAACVTVSDKWATSHEEELKRFLRGYQRAVNALYDPKMTDKIVQIAGKRLQIEPQYVKRAIQELFFDKETAGDLMPKDARIDRAGLVTAMEAFMEYGALKKKVDPSSVVDESYLDAAQKSLKEDPPK